MAGQQNKRPWTPITSEREDEQQQLLLDAARAGSRDAYGELLGLYLPFMTRYFGSRLPRMLRDKLSELDLVQDACLAAIAGLAQLRESEIGRWRAWLVKICRNVLAGVLRHFGFDGTHDARREERLNDESCASGGQRPYGRRMPLADERLIFADTLSELKALLAGLAPDERQIFLWHRFEGLSFIEIGRRLARSESAVRRAFGRVAARLASAWTLPAPCRAH